MAIHSKIALDRYRNILEERYQSLLKELEGGPAVNYKNNSYDNDWESRDGDQEKKTAEEYGKSYRAIDTLNLRLAVDDFMNILKEVKKLK